MSQANAASPRRRAAHFSDGAFVAAALSAVALTGLVAVGARTWVDRPFAGFFLNADRTVAAVGRASWSDVAASRLYGRTLVAVDGIAIADSDGLERRVAAKPIGSHFTYTLTNGLTTDTLTLASRRFSAADYWAIFGAYFSAGISYVLLAIVAAWALPAHRLGRALLLVGGIGGVFMVSSADLYPPAGSLRVHALAAAFLPAAVLQFALAIGEARTRFATVGLPIAWGTSAIAALSMQLLIGDPASTPWVQATCNATLGLALAAATFALEATRSRVAGSTARLVACAALFGLGVPAGIYLLAGTLGGIPVNASATLAFLFPLAMSLIVLRGETALGAIDGRGDVARSRRSI